MEIRRPTIKDVAAQAGVSVATVSNVLNGHAHVRERTRAKVLGAVDDLGYRASRAARSLPAGRTHLLGYCLAQTEQPNVALDQFLHQVVSTATASDLELLLLTETTDHRSIEPYASVLRRGGVDGFVLSGIEYDDPRVAFLRERSIPFACFGRVPTPDVAWVDVDGAAGMRAAVAHLVDHGHRRIAWVGWAPPSLAGDDRLSGFESAATDHGVEIAASIGVVNDFDAGRKVARAVVDSDATAVVCVSDTIALGLLAGVRDLGMEPGTELAAVGFDDVPAASLTAPGLTSLRQPMGHVGALLVERIIAQLNGGDVPAPVLVEPELIVRASTTSFTGSER